MKTFLTTLLLLGAALCAPVTAAQTPQLKIDDTVIRMPLAEDVTMDDAVDSMKLRANALNFKLVAYLPLYKEARAMGVDSKRVEIFQFCDARIASEMIDYDINFSAYLPCRITLIEDQDGKAWLITMNLDMFIGAAKLPPELRAKAIKVRDTIQSIMEAGANGDL